MAQLLHIEIVHATASRQEVVKLRMAPGSTVLEALQSSGLADRHPDIDARRPLLGIYGRRVAANTLLADGDRVEVYRPLVNDPKVSRSLRAAAGSRATPRRTPR